MFSADPFSDQFFTGRLGTSLFRSFTDHSLFPSFSDDLFSTFDDLPFNNGFSAFSFDPFGGALDHFLDYLDLAPPTPRYESGKHPEDLQSSKLHAATLRRVQTLQNGYASIMKLIQDELGGIGRFKQLISSRSIRTIFTKHAKVAQQSRKLSIFTKNVLRAVVETTFAKRVPNIETVLLGMYIAMQLLVIPSQHALLVGGACDLIVATTRFSRAHGMPHLKKSSKRRASLSSKLNDKWAKIRSTIGIIHRVLGSHLTCGQVHIRKKAQQALVQLLSDPKFTLGIRLKYVIKTRDLLMDYKKRMRKKNSLARSTSEDKKDAEQSPGETAAGQLELVVGNDINEDQVYDALQALWVGPLLKKICRSWPNEICRLVGSFFDESLAKERRT